MKEMARTSATGAATGASATRDGDYRIGELEVGQVTLIDGKELNANMFGSPE